MHRGRHGGRGVGERRRQEYQLEDGGVDLHGLVYHVACYGHPVGLFDGPDIECAEMGHGRLSAGFGVGREGIMGRRLTSFFCSSDRLTVGHVDTT